MKAFWKYILPVAFVQWFARRKMSRHTIKQMTMCIPFKGVYIEGAPKEPKAGFGTWILRLMVRRFCRKYEGSELLDSFYESMAKTIHNDPYSSALQRREFAKIIFPEIDDPFYDRLRPKTHQESDTQEAE